MTAQPRPLTAARAQALAARWKGMDGAALIEAVLRDAPAGRAAVVTSFGTESAALLHLAAQFDRSVPVLFVDTGRLFPETLAYRDRIAEALGLTDVRTVTPDIDAVAAADSDGTLHQYDTDGCCAVRKVAPYARALAAFDVEITGRKRFHGAARTLLPPVEIMGARIKVNPLAHWRQADIDAVFARAGLPRHPLWSDGFDSVGCAACTQRRGADDSVRGGRWAGSEKTECGIHFAFDGDGVVAVRRPSIDI